MLKHSIFGAVRTRVLVLDGTRILLLPPDPDSDAWHAPGGGLEPHESLAECAAREVFEETGLRIDVGRVAFLREWVVPKHAGMQVEPGEYGFGLEVFFYAKPVDDTAPQQEFADFPTPQWVELSEVPNLAIWPNQIKSLAALLAEGGQAPAIHSFVSQLEDPTNPMRPVDW